MFSEIHCTKYYQYSSSAVSPRCNRAVSALKKPQSVAPQNNLVSVSVFFEKYSHHRMSGRDLTGPGELPSSGLSESTFTSYFRGWFKGPSKTQSEVSSAKRATLIQRQTG